MTIRFITRFVVVSRAATVAPTSIESGKLSRWYATYSLFSELDVARYSNTDITFYIVGLQDPKWHDLALFRDRVVNVIMYL